MPRRAACGSGLRDHLLGARVGIGLLPVAAECPKRARFGSSPRERHLGTRALGPRRPPAARRRSSARRPSSRRRRTARRAARFPSRRGRSRPLPEVAEVDRERRLGRARHSDGHDVRRVEAAADPVVVLDREPDRLHPLEVGGVERRPGAGFIFAAMPETRAMDSIGCPSRSQ